MGKTIGAACKARAEHRVTTGLALLLALLLVGCGPDGRDADTAPPAAMAIGSGNAATSPQTHEQGTVLVMGDSLAAAYNLAIEQGWVALLDRRLRDRDPQWRVVNASISGETSAGGAARIATALASHRPQLVVLALGANDGLRGLPLAETRRNLETMVGAAQQAGARVLVVGMRIPPNYGPEYTEAFFALFGEVAASTGAAHLPFLLEPIALDLEAFQADRLHPTAAAQPILAEHVWTALAPLLDQGKAGQEEASRLSR